MFVSTRQEWQMMRRGRVVSLTSHVVNLRISLVPVSSDGSVTLVMGL